MSYDSNSRSGTMLDNPLLVTLAKHGDVSLIAADLEGRITAFFGDIISSDGLYPHIALGKTVEEIFLDNPDIARLYRSALGGEVSTVLLPAGALILEVRVMPLTNPRGEIEGAVGFGTDVTKRENDAKLRRQSEVNAKSQNTLVDDIFSSIRDGLFIMDSDFTILRSNPAFEMMNPQHMPIVGKKCYVTAGFDRKCDNCPAAITFETGTFATLTHKAHPDENGPEMWVDHSSHPIFSPDGKVTSVICSIRDITQRKENENALEQYRDNLESLIAERTRELDRARILAEEANELTQLMLDATPLCINLWDEQCRTLDCNLEALKLFEFSDKKAYLERFMECSPEFQPDGRRSAVSVPQWIAAAFETGFQRFEWMHQKSNGEPIPAEITLVRVHHGNKPIVLSYVRDLREFKKMIHELRNAEADERSRIMLDATPLASSLWDRDGTMLDCNMEALRLFGASQKSDYIDHFFDLNPEFQPDGEPTASKAKRLIREAFETGHRRFEWMYHTCSGEPLPVETTLVRVPWKGDVRLAAFSRDLRPEKARERQIRETDDRNRELEIQTRAAKEATDRVMTVLDAMPLCCHIWNRNGTLIDCNLENVNMFGFQEKHEFFKRFDELSPEFQPNGRRSMEFSRELVSKAFQTGRVVFEWMHRKLDGEAIPVEITLVRLRRGQEDIVVGYAHDLRERKKNEAILELDRQRMNALLELAQMTNQSEQDVVDFTIATGVKLTGSNIGYVVMFDPSQDVLPFRSLVFGKVRECAVPMKDGEGNPHLLAPTLVACLETKSPVIHDDFTSLSGERTFPGGHFDVRSHMNMPIFDGDRPIGILGVGNKETPYTETDVRQLTLLAQGMGSQISRRRYAENLENARNEAENANKAKSEFLAHMSHEIRTPLNGVIGLSDLLLGTPLNEKQNEYTQLINASGTSLLFLINDILDFSKIEAGKLEIDSEPFDLAATVESVLGILVSRTSAKNLELGVSFCRNLPRIVRGDGGRIRQILLNLVGNAVKFTDHGGVRIDVTIDSIHDEGLMVRFSVIDTGIGIPPDRLDRLFKAFSQADASSARVYGGTGLGLAISMKLVHLMGGEIGVESEPGRGSAFWFSAFFGCDEKVIRCLRENNDDCSQALDRSCPYVEGNYCTAFVNREIGGEYSIRGRTVLIVDNNDIHRDTLRAQMQNWEMPCTTCESGKEALQLLKQYQDRGEPFDLITVDNSLADGVGVDWMRGVIDQEDRDGVRLPQSILFRALAEEVDQEYLNHIGAEALSKPVFPSALFDALMNGIFFVVRQKKHESGISVPDLPENGKPPARRKKQRLDKLPTTVRSLLSVYAGKIRLLVVEDNRVNQIVAENLLIEAGFACDIANNGHEACAAVRNEHYDIVLMDCQMPEMDGYEATDLIRKWEREQGRKRMPIIALTANATNMDVQKCLDAGMDAYCSKPINAQSVIRLIEEWFEKSRTM